MSMSSPIVEIPYACSAALIRSFNEAFLLLALVFLFALLLVALLKRPAPGVKEEAVH